MRTFRGRTERTFQFQPQILFFPYVNRISISKDAETQQKPSKVLVIFPAAFSASRERINCIFFCCCCSILHIHLIGLVSYLTLCLCKYFISFRSFTPLQPISIITIVIFLHQRAQNFFFVRKMLTIHVLFKFFQLHVDVKHHFCVSAFAREFSMGKMGFRDSLQQKLKNLTNKHSVNDF